MDVYNCNRQRNGTRLIQVFWFSSTTWFSTVVLSICFAMPPVSCKSVKKWPSYGLMKFWWRKKKETKTATGILQIASRYFSISSQILFQIEVLVLMVVLMGGSSNSDQNWVRYDHFKLAMQIWNLLRDLQHSSYCLVCCTPIPSRIRPQTVTRS